jgi:hypothetical protein
MKPEDFKQLLKWFKDYVSVYLAENPLCHDAMRLKECILIGSAANITLLAGKLGLSFEDILLAKTKGHFHDIGRLGKFRDYGTFNDRSSCNHAHWVWLNLPLMIVLEMCRESERELIACAITQHNTAALPQSLAERPLFFTRLLRDADKLDIWKVFDDYYRRRRLLPDEAPNHTIELDLPDLPPCSPAVVAALREGRCARMEDLRTVNDFKLLQISWVYDLNFQPSFCLLRQRGYLEAMAAEVPSTDSVGAAVKKSLDYTRIRSLEADGLRPISEKSYSTASDLNRP